MAATTQRNRLNPLPSLIHASAHDAAARRAREAGREAWNRADYIAACDTQERLTRACYCRPWDLPGSDWPFVRFQCATEMQRAGDFHLGSDFNAVNAIIDLCVPPPVELWPHVAEARS